MTEKESLFADARLSSLAGNKPRILDLFCGAGGASMGYHQAGFEVVGVDINPQPNYPFKFVQADALAYVRLLIADFERVAPWSGGPRYPFAAIHASPPCQRHSAMSNCRPGLAADYPDMIAPVRVLLEATGLPYVIENVPGAPLRADVTLCGQMFGLSLYRHRLFETNFPIGQLDHPEHKIPASKAGHWKPGTIISVSGHVSPIKLAREVMGIDWTTREELAEAIPPAYTECIGSGLLEHVYALGTAA